METARFKAVKLLGKTFGKNGYSNIILDSALAESDMDKREKKLCCAVYYGVIERAVTLDHIISCYSRQKISKLRPDILNILRTGIYQLKYMDSIPDSACVNESVKLAKQMKLQNLSGFVNAVLRSFIRDEKKIKLPEDRIQRLCVEYSAPEELVRHLLENYSRENAVSLLESSVGRPPVSVRINTLKKSREEILAEIADLEPSETVCRNGFLINTGNVTEHAAFGKGLFHVQDIASQLCCEALAPKKGETVLDVCAAPGGKSFTMAELMEDEGKILSFDIHENRVGLIRNGAERLGIRSVNAGQGDALVHNPELEGADKVLCDVPCSGLGVIRRKPEIKYKPFAEFEKLPEIQYAILENAASYLKKGGELVYSTCTVNPAENENVTNRFLAEHRNFRGVPVLENMGEPFGGYTATLFPRHFGSDGFFISKLVRTE
ncbi:MAG: 16S rRNA (cytosine(967)-C(5))-methyltransferase RsmB [Porcipelethomonas sp.]